MFYTKNNGQNLDKAISVISINNQDYQVGLNADNENAGIVKLYNDVDSANVDGSVTQRAVKQAIEDETNRAVAAERQLLVQYQALTQSDLVIGALPVIGEKNTIYRVPGTTSYEDWMWDGSQFIKMAEYDNADEISNLRLNVSTLTGKILSIEQDVENVKLSEEEGFYVTDESGYIGLKYNNSGFDCAKLDDNFVDSVKQQTGITNALLTVSSVRSDMIKVTSLISNIGQSNEVGVYITDKNGNVVMKYTDDGLDSVKLSDHFLSLIPNTKSEIKILAIGNSYTVDAYSFLPYICLSLNIKLTLYFTFIGGSSLQSNWERYENNNVFTTYRYENGKWLATTGKYLTTLLSSYDWDYVILQQVSTSSTDKTSIQPYLSNFVDLITQKCPNADIGWLVTPAYGAANGYNDEQRQTMFEEIWNVVHQNVLGSGITTVIPECTAIENARNSTTLSVLGTKGQLNRDNIHLDYGIGRYTAACTVYMLLIYPHTKKSILNCSFYPIWQENVSITGDENSPARENEFVSVTKEQATIAQKCAIAAYMRQDKICDMSDF